MTDIKGALKRIEESLDRVIHSAAYTHPATVEIAQDVLADVRQALTLCQAMRKEVEYITQEKNDTSWQQVQCLGLIQQITED